MSLLTILGQASPVPVVYQIIENVYKTQAADTSALTAIANIVRGAAGIGAFLYIFPKLTGQIARNESIDFFPYLRPFFIISLIYAVPFICNVIDGVGDRGRQLFESRGKSISSRISEQNELINEAITKKLGIKGNDPERAGNTEEFQVDFGGISTTISQGFKRLMAGLIAGILWIAQIILMSLMQCCELLMLLLSITYRLVLRTGAPIAIVLAIFPAFTSNLAEWFGKYINYALLPMVASLYGNICFGLSNTYLQSYNLTLNSASPTSQDWTNDSLMGVGYIGLLIICIMGYFQVPSMTNMLVSTGGAGAMVQGATRLFQSGQAAAGRTASKATGLAAAGVQTGAAVALPAAGAIGGGIASAFGGGRGGSAGSSNNGGGGSSSPGGGSARTNSVPGGPTVSAPTSRPAGSGGSGAGSGGSGTAGGSGGNGGGSSPSVAPSASGAGKASGSSGGQGGGRSSGGGSGGSAPATPSERLSAITSRAGQSVSNVTAPVASFARNLDQNLSKPGMSMAGFAGAGMDAGYKLGGDSKAGRIAGAAAGAVAGTFQGVASQGMAGAYNGIKAMPGGMFAGGKAGVAAYQKVFQPARYERNQQSEYRKSQGFGG